MKDISKNYITIQGWMVQDLKLKSNDLLVFGIIYGFCQDGESEFSGSINYLCNWLNCSRPTISKSLDFLVYENLIEKRVVCVNKVTFNRYKISLQGVKKLYGGSKETLQGGSKETLHHNTNINIITTEEENSAVAKYPPIDFEELKTTNQIKNEYKDNPIHSMAPIISIDTFILEYEKDEMAIENICMLNKIPTTAIKPALKEFSMVCKSSGKDDKKTNAQFKTHFSNWVRKKIAITNQ
jgi:hypothetical protein